MGYQYRGTAPEPIRPKSTASKLIFDPSKCGTYAGYKQHQNHGVPQCIPCKKANSANVLAWRKRKDLAA